MTAIPPPTEDLLGPVVLRCRPRSGYDYWNQGCAAPPIYHAFFVVVTILCLASLPVIFRIDNLWKDTSEWLVVLYFIAWALVCFLAVYIPVCSVYSYWLKQGSLWLHENGVRGCCADLEFAVPFAEMTRCTICTRKDCDDIDGCLSEKGEGSDHLSSAKRRPFNPLRIVEILLLASALIMHLIIALAGGGGGDLPGQSTRPPKVILLLKGGSRYLIGEYLNRFRRTDVDRVMDRLKAVKPEVVYLHSEPVKAAS